MGDCPEESFGEKKVVDKVKIVFLIDEGFFRVRQ